MIGGRVRVGEQAGELAAPVQMSVEQGHDGHARQGCPPRGLPEKMQGVAPNAVFRRGCPEKGFIQDIGEEHQGGQRRGRQQERAYEIVSRRGKGARQHQGGAEESRNGVVEGIEDLSGNTDEQGHLGIVFRRDAGEREARGLQRGGGGAQAEKDERPQGRFTDSPADGRRQQGQLQPQEGP